MEVETQVEAGEGAACFVCTPFEGKLRKTGWVNR